MGWVRSGAGDGSAAGLRARPSRPAPLPEPAPVRWRSRRWVGLAVLVLACAGVRLVWLGGMPPGLNQDEASIGYDAWALWHWGIDRNGSSWPVHFISWGSGQNALYAYLSMPFIAVGGLSVLTTRLAMALAGLAGLWMFWRLGQEAGARSRALCALLVLGCSPWHIMASRWALESNLVPTVVLVATVLLVRSRRRPSVRLPLATAVLALSVYAYGTAYVFAPLFLLAALLLVRAQGRAGWGTLALAAASAALVALPMMVFVANNLLGGTSLQWGPISLPRYPSEARYESTFLPFTHGGGARLAANAVRVGALLLAGADDGAIWNTMPGWGALPAIGTPFLVWGVVSALRQCRSPRALPDRLMLAWLACALVTALTMTELNANRINLIWLPALWFTASGLWALRHVPRLFGPARLLLLAWGCAFAIAYFAVWRGRASEAFFSGFGDALGHVLQDAAPDELIGITGRMNMPYISVLFFSRTPPDVFTRTAVVTNPGAPFRNVSSFGRFRIGIDTTASGGQRRWVVHRSELAAFRDMDVEIARFGRFAAVGPRRAAAR